MGSIAASPAGSRLVTIEELLDNPGLAAGEFSATLLQIDLPVRLSLILYILLMSLAALITWQATGSPVLLMVPVVGILLYGALGGAPPVLQESTRIFFALLTVVLMLMQFGNKLSAIFIGIFAVAFYLGATQAIAELANAKDRNAAPRPGPKLSVFSMAFYAALLIAYVLLRGEDLRLLTSHRGILAAVIILLSLLAWELSRSGRLKPATTAAAPSGWRRLRPILMGAGICLGIVLVFSLVLPPIADAICKASPNLAIPSMEASRFGPPHRPKTQGPPPIDESTLPAGYLPPLSGPEAALGSGKSQLPRRGHLRLTDGLRLAVKFEHPSVGEAMSVREGIYIRSLALARFESNGWGTDLGDGFWTTDEEDGRDDGRVTVQTPSEDRRTIRHEVFIPDHDGAALPALVGVNMYEAPKIYSLPNDWYQMQEIGNLRYEARSEPKIWGHLGNARLEPGDPGPGYWAAGEGELNLELEKLAAQIFEGKILLESQIEALQRYFQANFSYSLKIENPENRPPLLNFLFHEKKGYCDFFSTAGALLLRKRGIATRVGFGYARGEYHEKESLWYFRHRHAHSWTEVYLKNIGWVVCDFTPSLPAESDSASQNLAGGLNTADFQKPEDQAQEVARETKAEAEASFLDQIKSYLPQFSYTAMVGATAALFIGAGLWYWWSQRRKANSPEAVAAREEAARRKQPAYYNEIIRLCDEIGLERDPGSTLREIQRKLKAKECYHPEFSNLTDYYYAVRYEDAARDRETESGFLKLLRDFRRERKVAAKSSQ